MKKFLIAFTASMLLIGAPLTSFAATCDEIIAEISQKIINNGVPESSFQLNAVPVEQDNPANGQVVGSCGQGSQKIIYTKGDVSQEQQSSSPTDHGPTVEDTEHPDLQPQTQP